MVGFFYALKNYNISCVLYIASNMGLPVGWAVMKKFLIDSYMLATKAGHSNYLFITL